MSTVIVFGPTGNVGSVAAQTAQQHGAKVVLAMRDPKKAISGLSEEQEKAGGYQRVQADLSKPDTMAEAVKSTGATRAFIYVNFGNPDHMRSTLKALKSAGITFIVLLSSFTASGELTSYKPDELIPYVHAQVELSLNEVYGEDNYVAIRPGGFATNLLQWKDGVNAGDVRMFGGHFKQDYITAGDMGRVSGTILANGPKNGQKKVYLYGPQLLTQSDAVKAVGEVLGKDIKITEIDETEAREQYASHGTPKPAVDYLVRMLNGSKEDSKLMDRACYDEGVANIELYTGRKSMGLKEWAQENKALWAA